MSERGVAERLARRAATAGGRLADLLAHAVPPERAAAGQAFLMSMLQAVPTGDDTARSDPFDRLSSALSLSPFEKDLLVLAGLPEEHEGYAGVLRTLHPRGEPRPTVGLAAQLYCRSASERALLRETLEEGTAVKAGALRVEDRAAPFFERSLAVADALWEALAGLGVWPAGVQADAAPSPGWGLEEWLASMPAARARTALGRSEARTILVSADTEEIAWRRGAALVTAGGRTPARLALALDAERVASVHALARGVVPVVRVLAAPDARGAAPLPGFATHPGPVVLCARSGAALLSAERPVLVVPAERLGPTARRRVWSRALPDLPDEVNALAARYSLEPSAAAEVAADVANLGALQGGAVAAEDVAASVRARANLSLTSGVKLIRPRATWEHLVLPEDKLAQLREAVDRIKNQSVVLDDWGFLKDRPGARGVRMLFTGPPGTGKSLAAEVVASAIGVDLLVVDISRVVSKWIGETEKNLAEVFDAAERAQAVLLFDEADALFGKRTEVSDAHDRYANLETAYLLSRLERFEGLAILSTNLRQNVDAAFVRRLEFVVEFHEPSAAERRELWRRHIPETAPVAREVDLQELAGIYSIVGGLIRNASVAAGFLAAASGSPISRSLLIRAIRREYEKAGRAFPGLPAGMTSL